MSAPALPSSVVHGRVVPVFTVREPDTVLPVARGLLAGGIRCVEITLRTAHAEGALARLRDELPGLDVGAGTVTTPGDVERAVAAGATFVVSPGFSPAVVARGRELAVPVLPGIATPTELLAARDAGLGAVKVYPAAQLGGPAYLAALAAVVPDVALMPSGGVGPAVIADYLRIPTLLAVSGSWMLPDDAVAAGDEARIARLSAEALAAATA